MKLSERLKQETQKAHKEAEEHMPFFRPEFGQSEYAAMIQRLLHLYSSLEKNLAIQLRGSPLSERLTKTRLLTETLNELNLVPQVLLPAVSTEVPNYEQAIGALYVIEGSTLGGQIIAKNFSERLGLSDSQTQFFRGYGAQTGLMWQKFKSFLDSDELLSLNQQEIIVGANQAFQKITQAMRA